MTAFLISMITLGFVTSFHCVAMCGPMVVSCSIKDDEDGPWFRSVFPQLSYQVAKILSYMTFGLLLGALGSVFNLGGVRPYASLVAGAYMVVLGLGLTGKVKWAQRFTPHTPKFLMTWIKAIRARGRNTKNIDEASYDRYVAPVLLGLITGLMPCGALIAAYVLAGTSGSAIGGSLGMLAFGLGTAPLMLALGTATGAMSLQVRNRVMSLLAIVVIVFGAVYINRGATLLGSPVTFNSVKTAVLGGPSVGPATGTTAADGVVEVPLVIKNTQYVPQQVQIPADKPVRLIVDRQENSSCSSQLVIPQLGIKVDLAPNAKTTVDIPATKAGSYTLTCGMGMMSGSIVVGGAPGAGGGVPSWAWLLLALGGAGGALWLARDTKKSPSKSRPNSGSAAHKGSSKQSHKGTKTNPKSQRNANGSGHGSSNRQAKRRSNGSAPQSASS